MNLKTKVINTIENWFSDLPMIENHKEQEDIIKFLLEKNNATTSVRFINCSGRFVSIHLMLLSMNLEFIGGLKYVEKTWVVDDCQVYTATEKGIKIY